MSEDNLPGEAAAVRGAAYLTHIEDYSVKSTNSNILKPRLNESCNDPMTPECHDSAISVSGFVAAANSPAEATIQPFKSTPATSPLTSNLNPMISAEFGAGLEDDREKGGEDRDGDGDDDALSGRCVTPACTLDSSVISCVSSNPGPKPSQEALALNTATFTGKLGHQNAISDECSSNDGEIRQSYGAGAPAWPLADGAPPSSSSLWETGSVCETKTVNYYCDIPNNNNSTDINPSFNSVCPQELSTYKAMSSLSPVQGKVTPSSTRRGGWKVPAGAGLRGGAPLPGETSAISNGTSGWGPPPSSSGGSTAAGTNGWGSAPPAAASSAWGSPQQNININNGDEPGQNNSKMLNTMPPSSGSATTMPPSSGSGSAGQPSADYQRFAGGQANQGLVTTQPAAPMPAGPAAAGSTSWAAAAGKGLPPSEGANQGSNGTTNKQLEQLNSVREALFSQDGWGCQNVKQDTSWDVGASGGGAGAAAQPPAAEPPTAAAPPVPGAPPQPPKGDSMQWTPPGGVPKNDGTDLWRSTLSGVPQPAKPQPSTPWGNHTPANPADYKEWGREDGGMGDQMPGNGPSDNDNMWTPGSGPGSSGSGGGGAPTWPDQERRDDRPAQFNDRDQGPNWGGPSKPKDEGMGGWNGAGNNHWSGGNNAGNGGAGWGPPPAKPAPGGGWGGAGPGGPPVGRPGQWPENDSPTMGRRFDDGGTSIWGGKAPAGPMQAGPPGGWKDMPVTNPNGARGPPGQSRLPPGPGPVKPSDNSPWGQPHPNRGWGEEGGANGGAWGVEDKPRAGGDMWPGKKNWDERGVAGMPSMRSSPSWDDPNNGMMGDRNWGPQRPNSDTDLIWKSRQFKILSDMGYRKEDVETALRKTNMQLDDALEMLNAIRGGGMPGRGMQPPNDPMFGPRAGDGDFGMRYPGPMPPYPPGDMPGAGNRPNMNPSLGGMNGGPMHGPPRPQPNGPPTNAQLRVLVQQIQMAVTAGHLDPQILNQPLAPQTLYLLNQLLNQIKQLQGYQQQQQLATQRPGASQQALLGLSAKIAQVKQHIQNLQNQITAQQAQYLKNQHPQQMPGGAPADMLGALNISENGPSSGGSKLLQFINKDNDNKDWRTPGAKNSASSPNFGDGIWSAGPTGSGWPDSNDNKPVNTSNSTDDDNFGIPEFVPGKAWKGTAQLKDPTEDPTMTPGSVASSGIPAPLTASEKTSTSSDNGGSALSSSTWSLATPNTKESGGKEPWSTGLPPSSSSTALTEMGQGLWGTSRTGQTGSKQQTPTTSLQSTWPASNGLSSSGGWSNGSTTTTSSYLGSIGQAAGSGSSWLLLKNLTAQIDGSTLRTLCMQHGPLNNFHLYLTHGIALVKYSNGLEAKKAQNALNNCVLGNTTILAATAEEQEVETIIRQLSQHQATAQGGGFNNSAGGSTAQHKTSAAGDTWSSGSGLSGWPSSSSVWGAPDNDQRTTPLNSFIPTDLLNEGM